MQDLATVVRSGRWSGLNVTIPYKQHIMSSLDALSPEAEAINAVNCIKFEDGRSIGHNTDAYGFEQSLLDLLDGQKIDAALVLGSGGAAAAVRYVLGKQEITYTTVSRRTSYLTYADLTTDLIGRHRLIVNTTPLGTYPNIDNCPRLPYDGISSDHYCYDLVYNPAKTLFLSQAEARGAAIKNGSEMLILQAERSWEIWNQ